jgi:hypothetical protein
MVVGGKNSFTHCTMAGDTFNLKEMYQMSNRHPQSRRLRELLSRIKNDSEHDHEGDYESPPDQDRFYNSHELYQEAATKITAEQDINIVREIALYYLGCCCSVMPDHAATMVFERMQGFE